MNPPNPPVICCAPRLLGAALLATMLLAWASPHVARAQEGAGGDPAAGGRADAEADATESEASEADAPTEEPEPEALPPRREVPNYDGREDAPTTPGQKLAWIPRILFYPVHLVTEYVIRWPLGRLFTVAEQEEIPERLIDAFRFGPRDNILLAPIFTFDFGLRSNIGVIFRVRDLGVPGYGVSAGFSFGGPDFLLGKLGTSYSAPDDSWSLGLSLRAGRRRDGLFFGIGQEANRAARSRFNFVTYDATLNYRHRFLRRSSASVAVGYRRRTFGEDISKGNTSVPQVLADGNISALPYGYENGYDALYGSVDLVFDSRPDRPAPGHGVRFHGRLLVGTDPSESDTWLIYSGALSGFVDMSGAQHVLEASINLASAEALKGEIPFRELPVASGSGPMSGFVSTLLTGESFAAFTLRYSWPVWIFIDGEIHASLGNVFGPDFAGFAAEDLRISFGAGLAMVNRRETRFQIMAGFGTDTLANGPDPQAARIMFGVTRDF